MAFTGTDFTLLLDTGSGMIELAARRGLDLQRNPQNRTQRVFNPITRQIEPRVIATGAPSLVGLTITALLKPEHQPFLIDGGIYPFRLSSPVGADISGVIELHIPTISTQYNAPVELQITGTIVGTIENMDPSTPDGGDGSGSGSAADILAKLVRVDGAGSGLDADLLDGKTSSQFVDAASYTPANILAKLISVDGAGSGLDADLLDGKHADDFIDATTYTAADILAKLISVAGTGSGLDADLLDGKHADDFIDAATYTAADILAKLMGVAGAGSGLDADLLDGKQASEFVDATTYTAANILAKLMGVAGTGSGLDADLLDGKHASEFVDAASYTAADILAKLVNVGGNGSGLDADLLDGQHANTLSPPGAVAFFLMPDAPTGWLKANGAAVSRTTYARLFAAIGTSFGEGDGSTTFNLPDLRGEFVRGWDDGRGVDADRVFGSFQADELKSHSHTYNDSSAYNYQHGGTGGSETNSSENNTGATGGAETRPRNIALLSCVKF